MKKEGENMTERIINNININDFVIDGVDDIEIERNENESNVYDINELMSKEMNKKCINMQKLDEFCINMKQISLRST